MNGVVKLTLVGLLISSGWNTGSTVSGCGLVYELIMEMVNEIRQEIKELRAPNLKTPYLAFDSCRETKINGVVILKPFHTPFLAFCDQTTNGGGWLVFQRRLNGTVSFNRNWTSYREGFGNPEGEYWLGLEKIHQITRSGTYELLVVLKDFGGVEKQAAYKTFSVASEDEQYKLDVGSFKKSYAGNSLEKHDGHKFSTPDQDNGLYSGNCAEEYSSGWWFHARCYSSNLNGLYMKKDHENGIEWQSFSNDWKVLMEARMMIRKVQEN